jgi:hypothetical protein
MEVKKPDEELSHPKKEEKKEEKSITIRCPDKGCWLETGCTLYLSFTITGILK